MCLSVVPRVGAVIARHAGAPVRALHVAVGSDIPATAEQFRQTASLPPDVGVDQGRKVRFAYRLSRVPTLVLVDPAGKVIRTYVGGCDEMVDAIDKALTAIEQGQPVPPYSIEGGG